MMSDRWMARVAQRPDKQVPVERADRNKGQIREVRVPEVRKVPEEAAGARADLPGANADPTYDRQLEIAQSFEKYWALYKVYCEAALDSENSFVPVEFQCVVDHDTNAVEELLGIVAV